PLATLTALAASTLAACSDDGGRTSATLDPATEDSTLTLGDGDPSGDGDGDPGDGDGDPRDLCGNSVLDPGETCDDGNSDPDDGCSAACVSECGYLCLELGKACVSGFHAVQCASPGPPFGQASPVGNTCQLATLSVDGQYIALSPGITIDGQPRHLDAMYTDPSNAVFGFAGNTEDIASGS
ncbi:MAG: hypothetical protein KDK70_44545, partial [Myxococcales bacterium]|nr:hypothetical protein [Myxococcales bacterium]